MAIRLPWRGYTPIMATWIPNRRAFGPVLLGLVYFVASAVMIRSTRFGGGVACLWIANGVLLASLITTPRRQWRDRILACVLANTIASGLFGLGWALAVPISLVSVGEAVLAAWLLDRWGARHDALDSLDRLFVFVLAAGVTAPIAGAMPAAAIAAAATGTGFAANVVNWFVAHALGMMSVAPVCTLVMVGAARHWVIQASPRRLAEGALLLAIVAATTAVVFVQTTRPLLFLPILPVILTTFRLGRLGAAGAVLIVAAIGGGLTLAGLGPVTLINGGAAAHAQFFQIYLAATVLTALPVAADLAGRKVVLRALRESEARFRLLTDNSTDIVMSLGVDGIVRYVSPSITQLGGYAPADVVGRNALVLVASEDRDAVMAAHRAALASPQTTQIVEYRAITFDGSLRWFESHTRGVTDEEGRVTGAVSAVRDVAHRKSIEAELSRVAATDPLTGLANRRAFDLELSRRIASAAGSGAASAGHVAIFDLDHFKRVNDNHGHAGGDAVLRVFARIARAGVREGDMVARLGGEEFGIILAGAGREQARMVCDRVRAALAAHVLQFDGAGIAVTASAGIAAMTARSSAAEALRAADAALYLAKLEGRDRLCLAA
jgi:diguanylate cyclase (GGDEF)-like protein/PAS domain S-box-containing protein